MRGDKGLSYNQACKFGQRQASKVDHHLRCILWIYNDIYQFGLVKIRRQNGKESGQPRAPVCRALGNSCNERLITVGMRLLHVVPASRPSGRRPFFAVIDGGSVILKYTIAGRM
jgi:hypothetical protein